jgi:hypothetical protein
MGPLVSFPVVELCIVYPQVLERRIFLQDLVRSLTATLFPCPDFILGVVQDPRLYERISP